MKIDRSLDPEVAVIHVPGRLDATTQSQLETLVLQLFSEGVTRLVLDFSELDYISSAGLRAVLVAVKQCRAASSQLVLAGTNKRVLEVIDLAGFKDLLGLAPDVPIAIAQAKRG